MTSPYLDYDEPAIDGVTPRQQAEFMIASHGSAEAAREAALKEREHAREEHRRLSELLRFLDKVAFCLRDKALEV